MEDKKFLGLGKKELLLLVALGFLVGVALKSEATHRLVIGFEDYKVSRIDQDYDVNVLKQQVREKAAAEQAAPSESETPSAEGASCNQ